MVFGIGVWSVSSNASIIYKLQIKSSGNNDAVVAVNLYFTALDINYINIVICLLSLLQNKKLIQIRIPEKTDTCYCHCILIDIDISLPP